MTTTDRMRTIAAVAATPPAALAARYVTGATIPVDGGTAAAFIPPA